MSIIRLDNAIKQLFKDNSELKKTYNLYKIKKIVENKLGDFFTNKGVEVKDIKFKTLYIICENSNLKSEINFRKKEIIELIYKEMGEEVINEIIFVNA